ncbi:MAG: hypothetical protein N4J56_000110 [Chroococcidiopsis sp. SAG 2025]|nr:hypothetical protein [Chroococcidiopsis sp. SAG 2025]
MVIGHLPFVAAPYSLLPFFSTTITHHHAELILWMTSEKWGEADLEKWLGTRFIKKELPLIRTVLSLFIQIRSAFLSRLNSSIP